MGWTSWELSPTRSTHHFPPPPSPPITLVPYFNILTQKILLPCIISIISQNPPFRIGYLCACSEKVRFLPRSCSFLPWLHKLFNDVVGEASYAWLI